MDAYLKGSGMLVTKVQWDKTKWEQNTVNNTASKLGVDIIEAKANTSSYTDKATDLYPAGATSFTKVDEYQVTNIAMSNRLITFDVNGGGETRTLDIEGVETMETGCRKILLDGQVRIVRDGKIYDLTGRQIR